jgi:hypothetical protein
LSPSFSSGDFKLSGPATMLIEHDFDWDPEVAASTSVAGAQDGSLAPIAQVVIIERRRGFSYGVLALAIVALGVSAGSRLSKLRHPITESTIHRAEIQPERRPRNQAEPVGSSTDGSLRATDAR